MFTGCAKRWQALLKINKYSVQSQRIIDSVFF